MNLKDRITSWLEGRDLSQAEGAKAVGVSPSTLGRWLKGSVPQGLVAKALERHLRRQEAQGGAE